MLVPGCAGLVRLTLIGVLGLVPVAARAAATPPECADRASLDCAIAELERAAFRLDAGTDRDWTMAAVALVRAEIGQLAVAQSLAFQIGEPVVKRQARQAIIRILARAGRFAEALELVELMPAPGAYVDMLEMVAHEALRQRDDERSRSIIDSIQDAASHDRAMAGAAAILAEQGRQADAVAALKAIHNRRAAIKATVAVGLAAARAHHDDVAAGMVAAAREAIEHVDLQSIDDVLADLAAGQAETGDRGTALATVATIKTKFFHDAAAARVVAVLARAGDFAAAGELVRTIATTQLHDQANATIALELGRQGKPAAVETALGRVDDEETRDRVRSQLAAWQSAAGDGKAALATAQRIPDPFLQAHCLVGAALAAPDAAGANDLMAEAARVAARVSGELASARIMKTLAIARARLGAAEPALADALRIKDPRQRVAALSGIAQVSAAPERRQVVGAAATAAADIEGLFARAWALRDLADATAGSRP